MEIISYFFQWREAGVEIALRLRFGRCPRTCIVDLLQYKEMKGCSNHLASYLVKDRHPRHFLAARGAWNVEERSAVGKLRGVHRSLLAFSGNFVDIHVWIVNLSCARIWRQLVGAEPLISMPNLQATVCDRIQEQERVGLQVIDFSSCFYIILACDTCFRRLYSRQVVIQLGWDRAKCLFRGLVGCVVGFRWISRPIIAN